jgi:hypothetical protein
MGGLRLYLGQLPWAGRRMTMRRLIHVPIIHSDAELGSLAESVKDHYAGVLGESAWCRREQAVKEFWRQME